jgi:transcription antitermination factor NusG
MALHVDIFEPRKPRGENWLCAVTKPGREQFAAANCELADFEAYLPLTEVKRCGEISRVPLFGGYLFVKRAEDYARIRYIEGIDTIIARDDRAIPVQAAIIADLRSREHDGIISTVAIATSKPGFAPGAHVRLTQGAQAGLWGVVERLISKHRASVSVSNVGRCTTLNVPLSGLVAAEGARA